MQRVEMFVELRRSRQDGSARVKGRALLFAVHALTGHAVMFGRVAAHDGFPNVVIVQVFVLVVGRIKVGDICAEGLCCLLGIELVRDRKSTRLNSSHVAFSYAVFCLMIKKYL